MIRTIIESDVETLANDAYRTFTENKKVKFYVNRGRSELFRNHIFEKPLLYIDKSMRDQCLAHVFIPPLRNTASHYFVNSRMNVCYINQKVIDRFMEIAEDHFSLLDHSEKYGVIDCQTNTELMPIDEGRALPLSRFQLAIRVSSYVVKLIE